MRSTFLKVLFGLVALALAPTVHAQTPTTPAPGVMNVAEHPSRPVVIELFSSQGCGNCPQANANVAGLARRTDVIAMTYPVGIWDYLGWSDTLAKPEFTERQKDATESLFPECRPGGPDNKLSWHVQKALGRDRDRLSFGPETDFHSTRRTFMSMMGKRLAIPS